MSEDKSMGWSETLGEHASNPPNPRTSGYALSSLGREWTISSDENRIKGQFEEWVRKNARKAIAEADREDGPEEADRMRSAYSGDWGAGHYRWDGRHVRKARADMPGLIYLLHLFLRRCHPDMTEELASKIFYSNVREAAAAVAWALGNLESPVSGRTPPGTPPATMDS